MAPFFVGSLFGRTCWTCLNLPLWHITRWSIENTGRENEWSNRSKSDRHDWKMRDQISRVKKIHDGTMRDRQCCTIQMLCQSHGVDGSSQQRFLVVFASLRWGPVIIYQYSSSQPRNVKDADNVPFYLLSNQSASSIPTSLFLQCAQKIEVAW